MNISFHKLRGWRDFVVSVYTSTRIYEVRFYRGWPSRITPFPLRIPARG